MNQNKILRPDIPVFCLCLLDHLGENVANRCAECKIYCGKCFTINNILDKLDNTFDTRKLPSKIKIRHLGLMTEGESQSESQYSMLKSGVLILTLKFPSPKKSPTEAAVLAAGWAGRGAGARTTGAGGGTTGRRTAATGTLTRATVRPEPELEMAELTAPETRGWI